MVQSEADISWTEHIGYQGPGGGSFKETYLLNLDRMALLVNEFETSLASGHVLATTTDHS